MRIDNVLNGDKVPKALSNLFAGITARAGARAVRASALGTRRASAGHFEYF